jgi:hypothetical protein
MMGMGATPTSPDPAETEDGRLQTGPMVRGMSSLEGLRPWRCQPLSPGFDPPKAPNSLANACCI